MNNLTKNILNLLHPLLPMSPALTPPSIPLSPPTFLPSISSFALPTFLSNNMPVTSSISLKRTNTDYETTNKTPPPLPPIKKSKEEIPPPSPISPLSKNSVKYSIDNLLKDTTEESSPPYSHHPATVLLTPPTSPQYLIYHQLRFNGEETLLTILENTIRRLNSVPTFNKMSGDIKSRLLEKSWLPLLLLGTFEVSFPLESFFNYLHNTVSQQLSPDDVPSLQHVCLTLERLRQCGMDKVELDLLKLIVLFNPCKSVFRLLIYFSICFFCLLICSYETTAWTSPRFSIYWSMR